MRVCEGQGVECNGHDLAATHPSRWSTGWWWVVESRAPQCVQEAAKARAAVSRGRLLSRASWRTRSVRSTLVPPFSGHRRLPFGFPLRRCVVHTSPYTHV